MKEAEKKIKQDVTIPANYWMSWGGQFEQMISARKRLQIVAPITILLIFLLLFTTFGSIKDAVLVFTGVPLALTGGVVSLWLRGIPLSISAGVGFIALSGVAVLNGLVMISFINKLRTDGNRLDTAILQGSITRLASGTYDRTRCIAGVSSDGPCYRNRGRSAASPCYRGDRRNPLINRPHIACASCPLSYFSSCR